MKTSLKVSMVDKSSQAERLGIVAGDLLVSYNGTPVFSNADLSDAIKTAKSGDVQKPVLVVHREGKELNFELSLEPLGIVCVENKKSTAASRTKLEKEDYKTKYEAAIKISSVIYFIGWVLVAFGVLTTFVSLVVGIESDYGGLILISLLPGIGTIVSGFLLIMGAQVTRATVDNADHTREILKKISQDK